MGVEIERKFLVDHKRWAKAEKPDGTPYRQGYLADDDKRTVRVRVAGNEGFITLKGVTTGITRKEYEYKIPVGDAAELIDGLAMSSVEKVRFHIEFEGHLWEVDEFRGDNRGLIVAEIELKDEDEGFEKPGWVTFEVSQDLRYYNSNLSKNPYKNWEGSREVRKSESPKD